jgi:hypothetical protein
MPRLHPRAWHLFSGVAEASHLPLLEARAGQGVAASQDQAPSVLSVFEEQGARCRLVAPLCHADNRAVGRTNIRDLVRTGSTKMVRLENIRRLGIVSLDKRGWLVTSITLTRRPRLSRKWQRNYPEGQMTRALPYAVTGAARDRRRRSGRSAPFDQEAAAHVGSHALRGAVTESTARRVDVIAHCA